ncbi:dehydrogenase [Streptomyces sp. CS113]|uniref:NAD(P)/FAD-dependent oxidoreductase n=1 Tax=Streptomyces sp. CS113 TaxID=1982761 RepID=UPI000B40BC42|nr:FAD-dependent oxidoreductase [Streptomyces sp. CS113]OWA13217.1 dehydrogenase [Streptomyces sp. CS113]
MTHIMVIGGGFAGVWSAAGAIRAARAAGQAGEHIHVTLISGGDDLVLRPRLYEDDPQSKRVALDRILGPIGVRRVTATVTGIDVDARKIKAVERSGEEIQLGYDKLVLATGSQLVRPGFPGAHHMFDIDTLTSASALDHHIRSLSRRTEQTGRYTAVVIGAGFTGLEIATALVDRLRAVADPHDAGERVRVVLVDRADVLGPELGPVPRPYIEASIDQLKIECRLAKTVASVSPDAIELSDGEVIPAATVVWTAGMVASPLTAQIPADRDRLGRLNVDPYMRVSGVSDVYAAGDTAAALVDGDHFTMQSCQHAQPMGKFAGHNVVADLTETPALPFRTDIYNTCLDLGPDNAIETKGWDRTIHVTGEEAKTLKQNINARWIYPSLDDAEAILAHAGRFSNAEASSKAGTHEAAALNA